MPILFLTRMCIITVAFIGGNGDDYYSITRALISDGSKLRAKNWCCSSSHYCGCRDMKWRSDIKSVRHKEWASAWESVSVCGFHSRTTTHTRAHTHLHFWSSKGWLFIPPFRTFPTLLWSFFYPSPIQSGKTQIWEQTCGSLMTLFK